MNAPQHLWVSFFPGGAVDTVSPTEPAPVQGIEDVVYVRADVAPVPMRHIDALIEQGRHEERAAIVAWLRGMGHTMLPERIEREDHVAGRQ